MTKHKSHNMRDTSLWAWDDIQANLGDREMEVYNYLHSLDGASATDWEITKALGQKDPNYVRPRRFDLVEKYELVGLDEKRACKVTGKKVCAWKVIGEIHKPTEVEQFEAKFKQQLRTIGEIEGSGITDELVEKTMKEVKDGERCKNCLAVIDEESYNKEYEDRGECHGVPCQELICTGYTCKYCGTEDTL